MYNYFLSVWACLNYVGCMFMQGQHFQHQCSLYMKTVSDIFRPLQKYKTDQGIKVSYKCDTF